MTKPTTYTISDRSGVVLWTGIACNGEQAMDQMWVDRWISFNANEGMTITRKSVRGEYRDNPEA